MKNDRKLVAKLQRYELYYISGKFRIPLTAVQKAAKGAGRSRKKVYAALREMGYELRTEAEKRKAKAR